MNQIPDKVLQIVDYVMNYVPSETQNWLSVKKEILWICPPKMRSLFTRRHYSTKKHSLNDLERLIITYWRSEVGATLEIPQNQIHNTEWKRHRPGWGLKRYNKERQRNAKRRQKQRAS